MRRNPEGGFTLVELLVVVGIVGLLAGIATPSLMRARMAGNEASAIASLRTINSSQINFAVNCGQGYYASSLAGLALSPTIGDGFIAADLSSDPSLKSGYTITMTGGPVPSFAISACTAATLSITYAVNGDPLSVGGTGGRFFFTNSGTIWEHSAPIATVQTGEPATGTAIQ